MKKNKKLLIGIGIVMLIGVIAIVVHTKQKVPEGDDVVRIGVILPLTGVSSDLGKPILEAMKIAENTVQERCGRKLLLDVEDGKSTAGGTITAYQKLMMRKPSAFVIILHLWQVKKTNQSLRLQRRQPIFQGCVITITDYG